MKITKRTAESIVAEISAATGRHVNLMDREGGIIASTDPGRVGTRHDAARRIVAEGLESLTVRGDAEYEGAKAGINLPLTFQGEVIAVIGITGDASEINKYQKLIRKISEVLLFDAYLREQELYSQAEVGEYLRQWLFEDEEKLRGDFLSGGNALGINTEGPWRMAVLALLPAAAPGPGDERHARRQKAEEAARRLPLQGGRVLALGHHADVILLLPAAPREALAAWAHQLVDALEHLGFGPCALGFDETPAGGFALRAGRRKAEQALRAAVAAGPGSVRFYADVMLEAVLGDVPASLKKDYLESFFAGASAAEMARWLKTLQVFYQCKGSITQTAARLYIHKNTLQYQLKKMAAKVGHDPRDIGSAALFQLAIAFAREG